MFNKEQCMVQEFLDEIDKVVIEQLKPVTNDTSEFSSKIHLPTPSLASPNLVTIFAKPNPAIMSVARLTRNEKFYLNVLHANAQKNLGEVRQHSISLKEFKLITGYKQKDYRQLKRVLANLKKKDVGWGELENDELDWLNTGWIASARIVDNILRYEYSVEMENLLLELKKYGYTKLDILIQKNLLSKYSLDLYEICKKFSRVRSTGDKSLTWWRKGLGFSSSQYPNWSIFYRDVFKAAIVEVNNKSDIYLTLSTKGRPAKFVKIEISSNTNFVHPAELTQSNLSQDLYRLMPVQESVSSLDESIRILTNEFGFSDDRKLIQVRQKINDDEKFICAVRYIKKKKDNGEIKTNLNGYAYKTLMNYTPPAITKHPTTYSEDKIHKVQFDIQQQIDLKVDYQAELNLKIKQHYEDLSLDEKNNVINKFKDYLSNLPMESMGCRMLTEIENKGIHLDDESILMSFFRDFCRNYFDFEKFTE